MSRFSGNNPDPHLSNPAPETLQLYSVLLGDELEIEGNDGDSLRLTTKTLRDGIRKEDTQHLSLKRDAVLLYYTVAPNMDLAELWNVGVVYGSGSSRQTVWYPLQSEQDAFRFQRLMTGYRPHRRFQHVAASALEQHLALSKRATVINVTGEAQLWYVTQPNAQDTPTSPLQASRDGSSAGGRSRSIPSLTSTPSGASILRDDRGRAVAVTKTKAPPLLVLFAKREATKDEEELFQMMRVDITNLECQDSPNNPKRLKLFNPSKRKPSAFKTKFTASRQKTDISKQKFEVYTLATEQIGSWNLCHLRPRVYSEHFVKHECEDLTLDFEDEQDAADFKKDILKVRAFSLRLSLAGSPSSRRSSSSGPAMSGALPVVDDPSLPYLSPGWDDNRPGLDYDGSSTRGYTLPEEM